MISGDFLENQQTFQTFDKLLQKEFHKFTATSTECINLQSKMRKVLIYNTSEKHKIT